MRPILAFTAAALVGAPAYADAVAPGAYDYIDGCIVLNSDTLIAYGTAPIAFPRLIFSCGDPTGAGGPATDPMPGPADTAFDDDATESGDDTTDAAELQSPPDLATGGGDADVPGNALLPEDVTVRPGDVLAVPEPDAVGLVGLGLAVLGLRRKRGARAAR